MGARMSNLTFRQDVDGLTQYLQAEYDLTIVEDTFELVDGWKCGHVTLANKFVKIRFVAGAPRDQFVDVSISPIDTNTSKAKRGLNVGGFAYRLGVHREFFPEKYSDDTKKQFFSFGSLVQLTSSVIFISVHCKAFLLGERSPLEDA
ncbi:MAG: hypothetical protein ACK6AO_06385 [Planctomycetota bacterium]|jgi:hypothetical protein